MEKTQFNLKGLSLFVGMPTNRDIDPRTVGALLETQAMLMWRGIPVTFGIRAGNSRVERARDKVVWEFMASDCNRLLWLDSDQMFKPEDVLRLLCFSTELDIVGAVYPCKAEPIELRYAAAEAVPNKWGMLRVGGMGLGFTMVARGVMEEHMANAPLVKFDGVDGRMPMIFRSRISDGVDVGEDIGFFRDCDEMGFKVWVDPAMKIGHIGSKVYEGTLAELAKDVEIKPLAESA